MRTDGWLHRLGGACTHICHKTPHRICLWDGQCVSGHPEGSSLLEAYDVDRVWVKNTINRGAEVVASLAPAYAAAFGDVNPLAVVSALRRLGFSRVEETSMVLGRMVEARISNGAACLSTSCPAVVSLVQEYYPHLIPSLAPSPSPMAVHGRMIRQASKDAVIVFIGPCLAKKRQSEVDAACAVDRVLTFIELYAWFKDEGLDLALMIPSAPDALGSQGARLAPIIEGISGIPDCHAFLEGFRPDQAGQGFYELVACPGGCLNGPGMPRIGPDCNNVAARKRRMLDFALGS